MATATSAPAGKPLKEPSGKNRIPSIDILRGLVMLIMAIDHLRDMLHIGHPNPTDLQTTTPALFFTRWITHFCAPTFLLLSGISASLAGQRRTKRELSAFLLKRGFWLVLLEVTVVTLGWSYDPLYHVVILQVIWAIGWSMVILGLLAGISRPVVVAVGLILFFGHNLMDYTHVG